MCVTVKAVVPEVNNGVLTKPKMLFCRQKEQTYTVTKMVRKAMKKREKTSAFGKKGTEY